MANSKLRLLVIPSSFPESPQDLKGIFIKDYISSVKDSCSMQVFYPSLVASQNKTSFTFEDILVHRLSLLSNQPNKFLKPLLYVFWLLKSIAYVDKLNNFDLIHAHEGTLNGFLAFLISKRKKVPYIITEHTGPFSKIANSRWKLMLAKTALNNADCVLSVSDHLKKEILASGIKPKEIIVTGNPVDTELFRYKEKPTISRKITFLSRLEPHKGPMEAIKAFHKLAKNYPDWKFLIGGEGPERDKIQKFIDQNELYKQVKLLGYLSKSEFARQLHDSSIFIFPSEHESFGLVIAEAISTGTPVITTRKSAPKEFVTEKCGVLVDPKDIDEISEEMEKMMNNLTPYNGKEMHMSIRGKYGFNSFGDKLVMIYQSVMR